MSTGGILFDVVDAPNKSPNMSAPPKCIFLTKRQMNFNKISEMRVPSSFDAFAFEAVVVVDDDDDDDGTAVAALAEDGVEVEVVAGVVFGFEIGRNASNIDGPISRDIERNAK